MSLAAVGGPILDTKYSMGQWVGYAKQVLLGGFNPLEKYEFVRLDHHPNYWGK